MCSNRECCGRTPKLRMTAAPRSSVSRCRHTQSSSALSSRVPCCDSQASLMANCNGHWPHLSRQTTQFAWQCDAQIQEAYESLIKRRGQPQEAQPPGKDSWDFHDWWVCLLSNLPPCKLLAKRCRHTDRAGQPCRALPADLLPKTVLRPSCFPGHFISSNS